MESRRGRVAKSGIRQHTNGNQQRGQPASSCNNGSSNNGSHNRSRTGILTSPKAKAQAKAQRAKVKEQEKNIICNATRAKDSYIHHSYAKTEKQ